MTDPEQSILPPLNDRDIYLYAHGNGSISLIESGGGHRAVTLAGALRAAQATAESDKRVFVGGDNAPVSIDAIQVLRSIGLPLEMFGAPAAPPKPPRSTSAAAGSPTSTVSGSSTRPFSRWHFPVLYAYLVWPVLAVLVVLLVSRDAAGFIFVAVFLLLPWFAVAPPFAFWRGGVPRRIDGSALTLRTVTGRRRVIDLERMTFVAAGGSPRRRGRVTAGWLLLGHADGASVSRGSLRRLMVPDDERDAVAAAIDRAVVVVLHGPNRDEVLRPIATIAARRGTRVTPTVRRLFAVAGRGMDK